jgi:hypothetical protein
VADAADLLGGEVEAGLPLEIGRIGGKAVVHAGGGNSETPAGGHRLGPVEHAGLDPGHIQTGHPPLAVRVQGDGQQVGMGEDVRFQCRTGGLVGDAAQGLVQIGFGESGLFQRQPGQDFRSVREFGRLGLRQDSGRMKCKIASNSDPLRGDFRVQF